MVRAANEGLGVQASALLFWAPCSVSSVCVWVGAQEAAIRGWAPGGSAVCSMRRIPRIAVHMPTTVLLPGVRIECGGRATQNAKKERRSAACC